ncbi:hypothetical protein WISP_30004 [Willisornis vidua]|uniref:Fibronectin type-III domain-containing protein n=1 Tax=Willisornis vidua TaxID=1566151 RepID=A0ABQ9DPW3_9PASS|nr:hypothetical protein WISP_30004 [Willisornis vidua]
MPGGRMWCRKAALCSVLELPLTCWAREGDVLLHLLARPVEPSSAFLTPSHLIGAEKCQKPQWDTRFIFDQEQGTFNPNEVVKMRCPEGHWPPPMEIKCVLLKSNEDSMIPRTGWIVRNGTGIWHRMEKSLTCVDILQVVPETLKISSTSIKLNWTCMRPDTCQNIRARCRLEEHSSSSCEAEEVKGEEMLHGQDGIFTCPPLQPFTVYSITISLLPSTILYTRLLRTKETVPDKPEKLWLDPSTGILRWKALPSCKGEIIGYQLNITTMRAEDGSFLEFKQVLLNRKKKALPSKAEEDHYIELQPYENLHEDNYCVIKTFLAEKVAAQGQGELDPKVQGVPQGTETCQRPHWDSRFQLAPDQENYKKNEEVMLSCPEGFQPSFTHVKCSSEVQSFIQGKPVYREIWLGRNTRGAWIRIRSITECIEVLQVVPGTFEISSTSIKLNWTCRFPDACQGMQAMCRLAVPSSPPCEPEEVKGEEMLHGQEGTFTCSQLQPFTDYSVTIFLSPSTIVFSWLFRTEETVPDKPEKLWLDPISGSLRWKALPSCKGEIIGYQVQGSCQFLSRAFHRWGRLAEVLHSASLTVGKLELLPSSSVSSSQLNIMARSARDSGFLEVERLQVNGSVTEHRLPEHGPGSSYVVSIWGLTSAGPGAALFWEFQPDSSDNQHPLDISCRGVRDISPSQGTAILSLQPLTSEDVSQKPSTYVAAVLNLTTPMDFMLGDRTWGQGYHNAALHPGWDYAVLLRLVHRSLQSEKFTCVCYSFSVEETYAKTHNYTPAHTLCHHWGHGQHEAQAVAPTPGCVLVAGQASGTCHAIVIGLVVLLAFLLMTAGILWLVLSRKRNYLPNKAKENN